MKNYRGCWDIVKDCVNMWPGCKKCSETEFYFSDLQHLQRSGNVEWNIDYELGQL